MPRPVRKPAPTASEQLEALLGYPWPFPGRPPKHNLSTWAVIDDWPEHMPVTEAEVEVFSRFFRDHFELEFYLRKLAKNGVKLVSITQEMGDDPMHVMMRQIMALFDEYQSKENAKHVIRALKENARQGFWNGSLPPTGYRVVAAEQRGAKVKKKLEIDPLHAETVRLIYRLALHGDGDHGQMGVKNIVSYLNRNRIFTRDGGRWGIGQVHRILTRRTYMGEHGPAL